MTNTEKAMIIDKYDNLIKKMCYKYNIRGYTKSELIQEIRTYLCIKLDEYDSDKGSYATFIKNYSRNKLRNMYKSSHNKEIDLESLYMQNLHNKGGDYTYREDVALSVAFELAYKSEYKDILLDVIKGMSYRDVGYKYNVSKDKVYRVWNDFIKEVKESL